MKNMYYVIIIIVMLLVLNSGVVNAENSLPPTMSAPQSIPASPITVTSPKVGDVLIAGETYTISWNTVGVPSDARTQSIRLNLPSGNDYLYDTIFLADTAPLAFGSNKRDFGSTDSFVWTVPKTYRCDNDCYIEMIVLGGDYRTNSNSKNYGWVHAGPFTIKSNATSTTVDTTKKLSIPDVPIIKNKLNVSEPEVNNESSLGDKLIVNQTGTTNSLSAEKSKVTFWNRVGNFLGRLKFW